MVRVKANPKYMFKILTTLSAMVLLSIIMIMGFWAATIQTTTISSTISFTATDVDVNIVGVVTGSETPVATYTTNISDKEFDTVSKSWDLGQLLFSGTTKAPIVIGLAVRNNGIDTNPYITCEVVGDVPSNVKVRYSQIGGENAIPYSQIVSANEFSSALISSFQAESSQTAVGGISIPAYNPSSTNNLTTGKVFYYQIEFSIIDFNQAVDSFNLALGMTIQSNRLPERDSVYQVESKIDSSSPTEGGNCSYEVINSTSSSSTIKFVAEVEEGYEFDGWYIKDNSDNASDKVSSEPVFITSTTADVTYYAKWKKARKVSFVVDGINKGEATYSSGTVSDFASAYEPSPYSTGWFLNEELTQVAKDDYLSTDTETSPVTLYCRTASITGLTFTLASDGNSYLVAGESSTSPSGEVVLPNKYEGKPVSGFYTDRRLTPAFLCNTNITSVVLSNNISAIATHTFYNSTKITKVTIPNTVTSIGSYAFYGCSGLTSIEIPNSVTSIGDSTFYSCSGLTSIEIPNSVTNIANYAFNSCSGLTSIEIPNSVTNIANYAFNSCSGLTSITIPNSVTNIGSNPFSSCSGLTSIVVLSGNTKNDSRNNCNAIIETASNTLIAGCMNTVIPNNVTSIGDSAFSGCSGLTSIEIPDSVTSIGDLAFKDCSGLTGTLVIPDGVTSIGAGAFRYCSNLTSIEIPDGITNIQQYTFEGCWRLISIEIPNSVTSIGYSAFSGCSGLTGVLVIPDSVTSIGKYAFEDCSKLTSIEIPNSVTSIEDSAFSGCSGLTSMEIPDSVTSIGDSAFSGCSGLTSMEIPDSVTSIGSSAFSGCSGLTSIEIPNGVTGIGAGAFGNCTGLTSIEIPNSVTSIGDYAFNNCSGLTSITIPNSVTSIGSNTFYNCTGLRKIFIPKSVTTISASSYGYAIFYNCSSNLVIYCEASSKPDGWDTYWNYRTSSAIHTTYWGQTIEDFTGTLDKLTFTLNSDGNSYSVKAKDTSITGKVVIPDTYEGKPVTTIGRQAFQDCIKLTDTLVIPNNVTSIGNYAFYNCYELTSLIIGNSVTSIGNYAFYNCYALTGKLEIPSSVTSIGNSAFKSCGLTEIFIPNSVTTISASSPYNSPFYLCSSTLKIYCEASSKPSGWSKYWNYYNTANTNILTTYYNYTRSQFNAL